jgi:hypothetical protein
VPEILNALKIKVNAEKLNVRNAAVRAASLLPKQLPSWLPTEQQKMRPPLPWLPRALSTPDTK